MRIHKIKMSHKLMFLSFPLKRPYLPFPSPRREKVVMDLDCELTMEEIRSVTRSRFVYEL